MSNTYDCCILGSGIAGTTSALVLARIGLDVLVVEAGQHPRFAIGESLVPTTTLGFDYLARTYGVPELRQISHYPAMTEARLTGWPKLGFWFACHRVGQPLQSGREMMFIGPGLPMGPDVHMLRQDVDAFLASRLAGYGVEYLDRTSIAGWQSDARQVTLLLERDGQRRSVYTRFVLDCSGHASFLANRENLRQSPTRLRTDTRAIFSHFRGVRFLEEILGQPSARFGTKRDAGTVHHCFDGGWIWIIRFDSGICSVGLVLDRRSHPDNDLKAENEFWSFINRLPTVREQLAGATPTRPLVKTGRLQFTSHRIFGDRYLLAPHAASFVDPLFSTGMDLTTAFIGRMAPVLSSLAKEGEVAPERLAALDACHHAEIDGIDRIVHGMVCSFRSPEVFRQYWRSWIHASLVQYLTQLSSDPTNTSGLLAHYGASLPTWNHQLARMYEAVVGDSFTDPDSLAQYLKTTMDAVPELAGREQSNWEIGSPDACCPFIRPDKSAAWFERLASTEPILAARTRPELLARSIQRFQVAEAEVMQRYQASQAAGTPYHRGVDFIRSQQF
jgi:FADH2 O2-dependent halogenase